MIQQKNSARKICLGLLAFVSVLLFSIIIYKDYPDIPHHNRFITDWLNGVDSVKLYSIYYFVLLAFSFFQDNLLLIHIVSVIVLTFAVLSKYRIAETILINQNEPVSKNSITIFGREISTGAFFAIIIFTLCISQNLIYKPSATMSLGYIPVNTWHNSTTIFLMPFALVLFYRSWLFLEKYGSKNYPAGKKMFRALAGILLFTIFTIFIKPSYFFVFAVAFPVYYLFHYGINMKLIFTGLVSILAAGALLIIYKYVFTGTESSVTIAPFKSWMFWSSNIPLSLLSSILFPLLFIIFYPDILRKNKLLHYGWINFLAAVTIYSLLAETGEREIHGNFSWQNIIANFILFLTTWVAYYPVLSAKPALQLKDKVLLLCYTAHFITGLLFLAKLPIFGAR